MILQIDVDGVLADFTRGFRTILHRINPKLPVFSDLGQNAWHYQDASRNEVERAWSVVKKSPTFWFDLDPIVDHAEISGLVSLSSRGHDVYFVTARLGVGAKHQTEDWLFSRFGIGFPTVIVTTDKAQVAAAIEADHAIEDNAANAIAIGHCSKTQSWLVDRGYNRFDGERLGVKVRRVPSLGAWFKEVGA